MRKVLLRGLSSEAKMEIATALAELGQAELFEEEVMTVPFPLSYEDRLPPNPGVQCHRCQKYVRGGSVGTRCPFCNSVIKGMMKRGKSNKKRRR